MGLTGNSEIGGKDVAQNVAVFPFRWSKRSEKAAQLVADDNLTDEAIAEAVNISRRQLGRWKKEPLFAARVREHVAGWKARIRERGLAVKERRVESYIADFDATNVILQERGGSLAEIPGGKTGFIVRDFKGTTNLREVFAFDAALFRERRAIREQIADELGQLVKRTELTGKDGEPLMSMDLTGLREMMQTEMAALPPELRAALAQRMIASATDTSETEESK